MSALDELKNKRLSERTELEEAILFGFEDWATGMEVAAQQLADKDAELLALRERVAKLDIADNSLKVIEQLAEAWAEATAYDVQKAFQNIASIAKKSQ